ncbi:MAG: outer membrane protein assembly factor BamD [Methylococcaceae bacterium]|nr:outer membrane protein assembly factor BamD [Methylococcaceae bacterium]
MINATLFFRPRYFAILLLGSLLSSCSLFDSKESPAHDDEHANWSAKQFFDAAKTELTEKSYDKAIKLYEKLEARYPFGDLATQAQLDVAYAYYKNNEPDSAIAATERFIKLNPSHERVDYAYYLKGLVNYNKGLGFLDRFLPTDSSQRDPGSARESIRDFEELIAKFPRSKYLEDSRQRVTALRNNLAMYEIHVADYYLRRGAYLAAARRCNEVVQKYPRTQAIPRALKIMEEAYRKLELNELADDAARVYALNYGEGSKTQASEQLHELTPAEKAWDFLGFDR